MVEVGMLVNGEWCGTVADSRIQHGQFMRQESAFRRPEKIGLAELESGRYHLFSSWSCPWSQRTMIARNLKQLQSSISMTAAWGQRVEGYSVTDGSPVKLPGTDRNIRYLHEVYTASDPHYTGRVTVPVLWDSKELRITANESGDIVEWFDSLHRDDCAICELFPNEKQKEIKEFNERIYHGLSNAVYEAGYSRRQDVYENKVRIVFDTLSWVDSLLGENRYVFGSELTAADVHLLPPLLRFSSIYSILFKCNIRQLGEHKNICRYMRDIMAIECVMETFDVTRAKIGYFYNPVLNPTGVVPLGPEKLEWLRYE